MHPHQSFSVLLILLFEHASLVSAQSTDNPPDKTPAARSVAENVSELDEQIASATQHVQKLKDQMVEVRKRLTDIDREWKEKLRQLEQAESEKKKLAAKLDEQLKAATKAYEKYEAAQNAAEAAQKAADEALKKAKEQKQNAEKAFAESEKLAMAPIETKQMMARVEEKMPQISSMVEESKKLRDSVETTISTLNQQVTEALARQTSAMVKIETEMKQANQWVSFASEVAPIFHQRCLACHNEKTAQGRYKMTTYNDIMSGGESGAAIEPGDAENSLLCIMVDGGSMPKEADPLTVEQKETIHQWVNLGARIDVASDPDESLIRIMPRSVQPSPPATYRNAFPVTAVDFHPSNKLVATSGYHELLLWSLEGELTRRIANIAERVYGIAFHPDGSKVAVASGTPGRVGEVKIFAVDSGELVHDLYIAEDSMFSVDWSSTGRRLAASGADGNIVLFTFPEKGLDSITQKLISDHADWVTSIEWSVNDQHLVSSSRDKTAKVFDAKSGKLLFTFSKHGSEIFDIEWSDESKNIVSTGADKKVRIWSSAKGQDVRNINFPQEITEIKSLSHQRIITAGAAGLIRIHRIEDGKQVFDSQLTDSRISSMAISQDENLVVVGDQSGKVSLLRFQGAEGYQATTPKQWLAVPE